MIIPEDTPETPSKLQQDQLPSPEQLSGSPPAYPGYSHSIPDPRNQYQPYPDPHYFPTHISPLNRNFTRQPQAESAKNRFFKALLYAIIIYLVLALLLRSFILVIDLAMHNFDSVIGYPLEVDGTIDRCVHGGDGSWLQTPRSQQISFDLPLSADVLYLFSRGSRAGGNLEVVPNDPSVGEDKMKVDIITQHGSRDSFRRTTICTLERRPGEKGIGIFTPSRRSSPLDFIQFTVIVRLPRPRYRTPLLIPAFEAHLPLFSMRLPELDAIVHFGFLSLQTSNEPINVGYINANNAHIQTSNSPITGTFRTSSSLIIHTSNSPISVDVFMENDVISPNATTLDVRTSNSVLTSAISLLTTSDLPSRLPRYTVTAKTSNDRIKIRFPQHQPLSHLDLRAATTNGAASVQLNPAYEGSFDLSTSNYGSDIIYEDHISDPTGQHRTRTFDQKFIKKGKTAGFVSWGSGGDVDGSVVVRTSNAPNVLALQ